MPFPISAFLKTKCRVQPTKRGLRMQLSDTVRFAEHKEHHILSDGGREANEAYKRAHRTIRREKK